MKAFDHAFDFIREGRWLSEESAGGELRRRIEMRR